MNSFFGGGMGSEKVRLSDSAIGKEEVLPPGAGRALEFLEGGSEAAGVVRKSGGVHIGGELAGTGEGQLEEGAD